MIDPAPEKGPETAAERWILAGFVGFLVLAFGAELAGQDAGVRWLLLAVLLAWAPMLVLHEFGHAWMARRVGYRIERVVIGFGAERAKLRIADIPVSIRTLPVEGFVEYSMRDLEGVRWRSALVSFAGPGIELAFAALWVAWVGPDVTFSLDADPAGVLVRGVVLAALIGGVVNLLPHSTLGPRGEIMSDGLAILVALFGSTEHYEARARARRLEELRPADLPDERSREGDP